MTTRIIVERRGFLYYFGVFLGICIVLGAIIGFFAWPLYIHVWPVWAKVITEAAWLSLLGYVAVLARRAKADRQASTAAKDPQG
jgi:hypothetical protein